MPCSTSIIIKFLGLNSLKAISEISAYMRMSAMIVANICEKTSSEFFMYPSLIPPYILENNIRITK